MLWSECTRERDSNMKWVIIVIVAFAAFIVLFGYAAIYNAAEVERREEEMWRQWNDKHS